MCSQTKGEFMKQIAITGTSGSMGYATYQELLKKSDSYKVMMLVRPSNKNIKTFKKHIPAKTKRSQIKEGFITEKENIKILWGDIRNLKTVKKLIQDTDLVINMAAIIPPAALHSKKKIDETNIGGVANIITAIKERENGMNEVKFINISSVAVYGDRLAPLHNIKVGDPVYPSIGDFYGLTKINAERLVIESGLKYWAVIRQSFISIPNLFGLMDPLMYLQPIQQCVEPVTWRDAGFGMSNLLEAPESFWKNIYNMGGGENNRFIYHEFLNRMFGIFGLSFYKCVDRNWFALRNFHCGYFDPADSARLNNYTQHQRDTFEDYFAAVKAATPKILYIAKIVPSPLIKIFMSLYGLPGKWGKNADKYPKLVQSYFDGPNGFKSIGDWDAPIPTVGEAKTIEYGYERKADFSYTIADMQNLAQFRGAQCLSKKFTDMHTPLSWKCHCGCEFEATPMLVTDGGHFCPDCQPPIWNYGEVCKKNKFLAQVYYEQFSPSDMTTYTTAELMDERKMKS